MERRLQRVRGTRSGNSAKETPLVTRHGRREVRYRDSPIRGALRTAGAADAAAARRACRERQRAKERTVVQMLRGCSWRDSYCWMRATGHAGHDSTPQRGEDASPSQGAAFCTRAAVVETLAHRCRLCGAQGVRCQWCMHAPFHLPIACLVSGVGRNVPPTPSSLLVRHTSLLVGIEHRMSIPANPFPWTVKAVHCMKNAQRLRQTRALPE